MLNKERQKWLIAVDLDGTLLDKNDNIPQKNIDVISKLQNDGHVVSIITGRPFRSSKHIYEKLGLNSIMGNHNGAILHNPSDPGFISTENGVNRKLIAEFTNDPLFIGNVANFAVETKTKLIIKKHDKWLEEFFFIEGELEIEVADNLNNMIAELPIDPYSMLVLMESKVSKEEMSRAILDLKTKYGDSLTFRSWQHPKVKDQVVLEVNPIATDKGHALRKIRNYHNIHSHKTMVFGDGLNDVQMFEEAAHAIVMSNADENIRFFGSDMTFKNNNDAGVGDYLEKWFYGENEK